MTCTTTHHACDCVLKRMEKLERLVEVVKITIENCESEYEHTDLIEALKELES
jgi:hypothetical protein